MHYKFTVYAALYGWIPLVLCLFAIFPPRKALLIGFIGGWLFLPCAAEKLHSIPTYSKLTAASYASLFGTMFFCPKLILTFRPRWFDVPMLAFCLTPFMSSINNGLGPYDGGSAIIEKIVLWGLPYFLGRIYFPDWESITELGMAIIMATAIYAPFCWVEMRFSPQFHNWLYGFHQNDFAQTSRMGGYRPMVFMQHGLALAMWMNCGTLIAVWMWISGTFKKLWGIPIYVLVPALLGTTILCRSLAGILFLFAGLGVLFSIKYLRTPVPLLALVMIAPAYMCLRVSGTWTGEWAIQKAEDLFGPSRAQSLSVRINAENLLSEKAMEQPWFGWGRWNRNRVYDIHGKDTPPIDGLWIITFGTNGLVGLTMLTIAILMPSMLIWRRCPLNLWTHPGVAATTAIAVLLVLHMIDNILNGMLDPVFMLALGGLAGVRPSIRNQVNTKRQVVEQPFDSGQMYPAAAFAAMSGGNK